MSHVYGQFHAAESTAQVAALLHIDRGGPLHEVTHEPPCGVLDQEDLVTQGITTAELVPGAKAGINALGDCVYNAGAVAFSGVASAETFFTATGASSYTDVVDVEKFSIRSYHLGTDQTGTPTQEWPPNDCGSTGAYLAQFYQAQGYVAGQKIAHGPQNIISLLQTGGVLEGGPFLNVWEEPPSSGIVDGNGSTTTLEAQVAQGVAGGHETYITAIVKLALTETGIVIPGKTLLRVRNSWSQNWGDNGSFYLHLSTLVALGQYYDFRQLVA